MSELAPSHPHGAPALRSAGNEFNSVHPDPYGEHWMSFTDLVRIARVKWRLVLGVAAVVAALATAAAFLMTPLYMGSALVMVDLRQNHVFNPQDDPSVLSDLPADPSSIDSQVQLLKSHALASRVVDKLGLVHNAAFNGGTIGPLAALRETLGHIRALFGFAPQPGAARSDGLSPAQTAREKAVSKLLSRLNVYEIGHSTVIEIDARATSAPLAAKIANAIADTYVGEQTNSRMDASASASKWLSDRVKTLARQAATADAKVQQYKAAHGIMDTSTGTSLTDQQLGDLTSQLITAEANRADAEAKMARVNRLVRSGRSADVTEVVDSPLITELREQETTLLQRKADLSSRYGPLHPKMRNIDAQLRELKAKIAQEVNRVVGTVSNGVAVAAAHVSALRRSMSKLTSATNGQNKARVKLAVLQANAASAHALYQTYLDRLRQTQQQASLKVPDVHVASPATVPLKPSFPNKLMIVGGAVPIGLLLGFLIALVSEKLCGGFRSATDLEAAVGLPVLAVVPELKSIGSALRTTAVEVTKRPQSQYSEAMRGLEINVLPKTRSGKAGRAIVVTSALPAEGKTTTAASLARRLALSGYRVVAVDADLRRPRLGAALGLRKAKHCLADYLNERCSLDEALSSDPHSPLVALTAAFTADPATQIGSPQMRALVDRLRQIADFVIIDSPPALAVHDTKLLSKMADSTLLVVRWENTPREAVSAAARSLADFDVVIAGAALVRADPKRYPYYAYGYMGAPSLAAYYEG